MHIENNMVPFITMGPLMHTSPSWFGPRGSPVWTSTTCKKNSPAVINTQLLCTSPSSDQADGNDWGLIIRSWCLTWLLFLKVTFVLISGFQVFDLQHVFRSNWEQLLFPPPPPAWDARLTPPPISTPCHKYHIIHLGESRGQPWSKIPLIAQSKVCCTNSLLFYLPMQKFYWSW